MMRHRTLILRIVASLRSLSPQTLSSPPPGQPRLITSFFIAAYLLCQLALPLSYYAGEDKSDERFAWRMFSTIHFLRKTCVLSLGEWRPGGRLRPLTNEELINTVPRRWMKLFFRNWVAIVEKVLRSHCRKNPALSAVELRRKCDAADGSGKTLDSIKMSCPTGEIKRTYDSL